MTVNVNIMQSNLIFHAATKRGVFDLLQLGVVVDLREIFVIAFI